MMKLGDLVLAHPAVSWAKRVDGDGSYGIIVGEIEKISSYATSDHTKHLVGTIGKSFYCYFSIGEVVGPVDGSELVAVPWLGALEGPRNNPVP